MNKPLYTFFTQDHHRVESFLDKATEIHGEINSDYYEKFRVGLLTHIKMEEKILFLAAQRANNNVPLPIAGQLRLEHGALTALLVPTPTLAIIKVIRYVLERHDLAEEEPGGMYDACEHLTQSQTQEILEQLHAVKEVPVHPHNDIPLAMQAAKRALNRAGYDFDDIVALQEE